MAGKLSHRLLAAAVIACICTAGIGEVRHVPSQYSTIQAAINDANEGDVVAIAPGTYKGAGNTNVTFAGKAITVRSEDPNDPNTVAATIIDCEAVSNRRGFAFTGGEGQGSVLAGLTVLNGVYYSSMWSSSGYVSGCGVYCAGSSPRIEKCVFRSTTELTTGHALCFTNSNAVLSGCTIENTMGGPFHVEGGNVLIEKCIIRDNKVLASTAYNGTFEVRGSIISGNCNSSAYAMRLYNASTAVLRNCSLWGNGTFDVHSDSTLEFSGCNLGAVNLRATYAVDLQYTGQKVKFEYCAMRWGQDRINAPEPAVVEMGEGNFDAGASMGWDSWYELKYSAECVNRGDPDYTASPDETDINRQPRVVGGRIDVGAAEAPMGIDLVSPCQDEVLAGGSIRNIRWISSAQTVDIFFSSTGGATWTTVAAGATNTGSFAWSVPRRVSYNCIIAIEGVDGDQRVRAESGTFEIRPYMTGPAIGSQWSSIGGGCQRRGLSTYSGPETGCVLWAFETYEPVTNSVVVGANGIIYVACDSGIVYAVDTDGWMMWGIALGTEVTSSPTIGTDGTVYIGCASGELIALSYDGNIRWTYHAGGMITGAAAVDDAGRVFVASTDGVLYGLGADGSDLWQYAAKPGAICTAVVASPTIGADGGILVADAYWPVLYCLDAETGSSLWQTNFTMEVTWRRLVDGVWVYKPLVFGRMLAAPAVGPDGTIYAMFEGYTKLYAIEPNGVRKWDVDLADKSSGLFAPYGGTTSGYPLLVQGSAWSEAVVGADGTIYVSLDDPYIRAVEPNGVIRWVLRCGMQGGFRLTVGADGLVYACSDEGSIYVIEPDGRIAALFDGGGWMNYPVIGQDGIIYVSDSSGIVWAIGRACMEGERPALRRFADSGGPRGVNFVDYALITGDWMETTWDYKGIYKLMPSSPKLIKGVQYLATDANRDAYVDMMDIAAMAQWWLDAE